MELTDRQHIADIRHTASLAHSNAAVREALFAAMLTTEGRQANNAAWVLTHLPKADNHHIATHRSALVDHALTTADATQRRLTLVLLERIDWPANHLRADLLDFCFAHLANPAEAAGIRSLCAKLAYAQSIHYSELGNELRATLQMLLQEPLSAGLLNTCRKLIVSLNNR